MNRDYDFRNNSIVYTQKFNGLTFETLSSIIYDKESLKSQKCPISFVEADVNFNQSIDYPKVVPKKLKMMASIGAVPICKLTDYESLFSFEMMYIFLHSISQLQFTQAYSPIELRIAKFSDHLSPCEIMPIMKSFSELLAKIAHQVELEVESSFPVDYMQLYQPINLYKAVFIAIIKLYHQLPCRYFLKFYLYGNFILVMTNRNNHQFILYCNSLYFLIEYLRYVWCLRPPVSKF
ncbi:hypothetical protein FGO68_gene5301 [Halteria grandinella]|uniref:Uncharacterized protein n=1 Tax=Halteria grandinella TaxID=5974 RepID=A0A8J8SWA2_HALGN|nr:hypothetical protein FGO68_gene5301 [Halteria grandinella]